MWSQAAVKPVPSWNSFLDCHIVLNHKAFKKIVCFGSKNEKEIINKKDFPETGLVFDKKAIIS